MSGSLLDRVDAVYRAGRSVATRSAPASGKAFSEPPFWSLDSLRLPMLAASTPGRERVENNFEGYVQAAYKSDGIIFACIIARMRVFAQARFGWREEKDDGTVGDLFTTPVQRRLLRRPAPRLTLGNLLSLMEVDASLAGNFYASTVDGRGRWGAAATGPGRRVVRMRPDWVWIIIDSPSGDPYALDAKIISYIYEPPLAGNGIPRSAKPVVLLPHEVVHYSPVPDPIAQYRGMSWLTPVLREIASDKAATAHKLAFFERGATLQTVASLDKDVPVDAFDAFVERFRAQHEGVENAYGTLFLGGGADVTVIGTDLQRLDYKNVQGGGETRMAAAAGVHPTLVGLSEGLSGSSLNQGNFNAARRIFVDGTMRWLWGEAAASLETLFDLPNPDAYLDVDTRSIPFMREDAADAAEIMGKEATVLRTLGDGGWDPPTIVEAIRHRDWARLKHSGKLSVQLQPPGQQPPSSGNGATANGVEAAKALMAAAWGDHGPH